MHTTNMKTWLRPHRLWLRSADKGKQLNARITLLKLAQLGCKWLQMRVTHAMK
jgi:hypothetical protein